MDGDFRSRWPLSKARLETHGYKVEWHEYGMPHSVCAEEIDDIAAFLEARAGADPVRHFNGVLTLRTGRQTSAVANLRRAA